ncbi:MAG: nucleolar RNA-binding Nop10p family protein [Candidatus Pacearchaeota archaeon]
MSILKKCNNCGIYTLLNRCNKCGNSTKEPFYLFKKIRDAPKESSEYFSKLRRKKND